MEAAKRVLVYLKKNSVIQRAKFAQSITGYYSGAHERKVLVHCGLDHNKFVISDRPFRKSCRVELRRLSPCPISHFSSSQAAAFPEKVQGREIGVAITVLLQSANQRVLLIRRSKTLSVFPNAWVPPGGHLEIGEQLFEAGRRELEEETNLQVHSGNVSWSMLGLWESVYPPALSQGMPQFHHIVMFLLVHSIETHQQLHKKLRLNELEVSACLWVDPCLAGRVVGEKDLSILPSTASITEVKAGVWSQRCLDLGAVLSTELVGSEVEERFISGTKYALGLWLNTLRGYSA
ncbi:nucleoside diphosphate-linked moiety X motif 17-like [Pelobates fuscus]|uniref:nucleoside diphosphate-linked moiety X motif 17-like n=1 Tax=Pelobates fuscus TaxID=191477 RepID=UPI002FE4366C